MLAMVLVKTVESTPNHGQKHGWYREHSPLSPIVSLPQLPQGWTPPPTPHRTAPHHSFDPQTEELLLSRIRAQTSDLM